MVYKFFRLLANIAIRVFYGKLEVDGIENIPKNVPLLIASNHPNGFLEPIIMACLFPRPLHFMVRGDVFKKKWLKPILIQTNQIPIFRFKDGFSQLRKNDSNLKEAYKALDKGAAIILFIEGGTINIKKLRPFQKGLARMASDYLSQESSRKDLHILPVAINFVSPFVLRSRVFLNIGKPSKASDCFNNEKARTVQVKTLTDKLYQEILPMAFHVNEDSRQRMLNVALRYFEGMFRLPFFPTVDYKNSSWVHFKKVTDAIDSMDDHSFSSFTKTIQELDPIKPNYVQRLSKNTLSKYIISVLLLLPAVVGFLWNIIPGSLAQLLEKRVLDEENKVFKASIILSSGVGFYSVYYFVCILILGLFFGLKSLWFLLGWPLGFLFLFWKNNVRSSFLKHNYTLDEDNKQKLTDILDSHSIPYPNIDTI